MVLNLIKRGPETLRLEVAPGSGLQGTTRNGSSYPLRGYGGWVQVTVTAADCAGIQVMDRENGYNRELRSAANGLVSYTGVFYSRSYGPTVHVSDPNEKTEVIMHVVPIPPPLRKCVLARLVGWWSKWR